jgi:hypothetical protein
MDQGMQQDNDNQSTIIVTAEPKSMPRSTEFPNPIVLDTVKDSLGMAVYLVT